SRCNLASHFANCPDLSLRNPRRAIELARQAAELAPQEAVTWTNVGMAYYRGNDSAPAGPALLKSMDLSDKGTGNRRYFLAMAYWQLARKEDARTALARALQDTEKDAEAMRKDWILAEEVRCARAEASMLIRP